MDRGVDWASGIPSMARAVCALAGVISATHAPVVPERAYLWGMVTRGTKFAGIQGPEHAISVGSALELYTMGTARLNREQGRLGSSTPDKLADLVGYPLDPLGADPDDLAELTPAFTIAGGRATHDPDKRLAR